MGGVRFWLGRRATAVTVGRDCCAEKDVQNQENG